MEKMNSSLTFTAYLVTSFSRGIDPQTHRPLKSTTATSSSTTATTNSTSSKNSNMCTKTSTRFHLEEQNYPFLQVQPELTMSSMIKKENNSDIIKVGGSSTDSAEDSNSSSGVTTELEVYPDHKLVNLELSIGLPSQAPLSSINNLKQAKQQEQEEVATHQLFETSTTTSTTHVSVHKVACLCYKLGFKKSQACSSCDDMEKKVRADNLDGFYRPLDA
ncbi:hypothetical protein OIU79_022266 [Salix purpurea]|uniref:Uncharacterized protein n=1 Tax=Salix purpurea TaxID=77065 RepID=A0A9Q0WFF6_SALPP|nr:hypothetical protein OIU79_022266 [Salix purpurea]